MKSERAVEQAVPVGRYFDVALARFSLAKCRLIIKTRKRGLLFSSFCRVIPPSEDSAQHHTQQFPKCYGYQRASDYTRFKFRRSRGDLMTLVQP